MTGYRNSETRLSTRILMLVGSSFFLIFHFCGDLLSFSISPRCASLSCDLHRGTILSGLCSFFSANLCVWWRIFAGAMQPGNAQVWLVFLRTCLLILLGIWREVVWTEGGFSWLSCIFRISRFRQTQIMIFMIFILIVQLPIIIIL